MSNCKQNIHIISAVRKKFGKNGSQNRVFCLPFRHHSHQDEKKKMRDGEKNNCLTLVSPAIVVSMWNTKRPLLVKCVPLTQCVLSRLANVCSWTWYFLHYDIEETWITHIFLIIFDFPLKLALYSTKHRKNCECCPGHSLFKGHNVNVNIVVLNCQKCNQCLKCQVSGHKSLGLLFEDVFQMLLSLSFFFVGQVMSYYMSQG